MTGGLWYALRETTPVGSPIVSDRPSQPVRTYCFPIRTGRRHHVLRRKIDG